MNFQLTSKNIPHYCTLTLLQIWRYLIKFSSIAAHCFKLKSVWEKWLLSSSVFLQPDITLHICALFLRIGKELWKQKKGPQFFTQDVELLKRAQNL